MCSPEGIELFLAVTCTGNRQPFWWSMPESKVYKICHSMFLNLKGYWAPLCLNCPTGYLVNRFPLQVSYSALPQQRSDCVPLAIHVPLLSPQETLFLSPLCVDKGRRTTITIVQVIWRTLKARGQGERSYIKQIISSMLKTKTWSHMTRTSWTSSPIMGSFGVTKRQILPKPNFLLFQNFYMWLFSLWIKRNHLQKCVGVFLVAS